MLAEHAPSPLEMQMAKQLKEQSLQMEEMKQLMEGMKALIIKMEVETTHLRAARGKRSAAQHKADEPKPNPWTCPTDGCVYPWTYKGVKYLRNSENQVWMYDGKECGDWKGLYIMAEDRIDETARDPFEDESA
jgi:hypothetical protein